MVWLAVNTDTVIPMTASFFYYPNTSAGSIFSLEDQGESGRLGCGIHLSNDLRRPAVSFASRSGTSIEIVRKVIMRHAHLSTTQQYLGETTEVEAMRWIENLYG